MDCVVKRMILTRATIFSGHESTATQQQSAGRRVECEGDIDPPRTIARPTDSPLPKGLPISKSLKLQFAEGPALFHSGRFNDHPASPALSKPITRLLSEVDDRDTTPVSELRAGYSALRSPLLAPRDSPLKLIVQLQTPSAGLGLSPRFELRRRWRSGFEAAIVRADVHRSSGGHRREGIGGWVMKQRE